MSRDVERKDKVKEQSRSFFVHSKKYLSVDTEKIFAHLYQLLLKSS
jgi:hypothetical protein